MPPLGAILWGVCCAVPALDALGRLARLTGPGAGPAEPASPPRRLVVLVPARGEGERLLDVVGDLARERASGGPELDAVVIFDGGDPEAEARVREAGLTALVKEPAGPSKGAALAFAAARLGERIASSSFVVVLDADTRLPAGWLGALSVPAGTDVFQLPVRAAGVPPSGAARVEAFSLATATRVEDAVRDARGWPVRLRGKAMGFSPAAWSAGPARGARTLVEDSEATLALVARGFRIRALTAPIAFEAPAADTGALSRPRARWFAGHLHLLAVGLPDLAAAFRRSPLGTATLAADLFLRPRALVLAFLAASAGAALVVMARGARWAAPPLVIATLGLACEALYARAARRRLGISDELPRVTLGDLASTAFVWLRAIGLALRAPGRWHRAR